ncbi:MAG: trypsin-like peptidase domain-containing protein [Dehalococcoidia bacterium]|jgi:serine protease Do|nr:trypsin-like peptidase domain-containing protein [Dehalococcoidia bacterium]
MKRINGRLIRSSLAGLALLLVVTGCASTVAETDQPAVTPAVEDATPAVTQPAIAVTSSGSAEPLPSIADVVAKVKPSVVAINTEAVAYDMFNRPRTEMGAGSGWIISADGYIVTNNHVVEGATVVTVTLDDGTNYEAGPVFTDPLTDLAVVKIAADGLPVAETGDATALRVGDVVVAIGNSLGMGTSATSGIVSAAGVSLSASAGQTLLDLIQTDAAINPGNSGGPLVNMAGQVIGINSNKIASIGVEGMGYAITVNQALPVVETLIGEGRVARPWLGVGLYTVSPLVASRYGLAVEEGVLVTEVVPASPAEVSGLMQGDVIVVFAGQDIRSAQDFTKAIFEQHAGDEVEITFWRGDEQKVTWAILAPTPAGT